MATILDPGGTPSIVYNKSGTVVVEVTAAGAIIANAAPIPYYAGRTIALCTPLNASNYYVCLPTGAEIGDIVEVYSTVVAGGQDLSVVAPSGETLDPGGPLSFHRPRGIRCVKVSSTQWQYVG